ncbi:MAG: NAD-dependent epimerase/dehydratase family protein [Gemmatimonadetes bacterium]|nr:NAD-dependent epimerase/dehydratase family protein [Gemmatimonadota bacterium]
MARVLVIGGTLFIGRALVAQLLARGDEVVIMHRGHGTPFGDRVGEIRCDRNDVAAVRAELGGGGFDVIYDNVYDWQRGTTAEQIVAAAEAAGAELRRYIFTSSIAAYAGGLDLAEDAPLAPADHPNVYGAQKAASERALFALQHASGLAVSTLRPAFVYGKHNGFDREAFFWDRIRAGRPVIVPGDGSRLMQWVMAADVARAAILAADTPAAAGRAYNLGNWPPVTQVEFVQALARAAGRSVELVHVPRERIRAAGGSLTHPPLYFGTYLDLPSLTVRTERLRAELGLELTTLDEGLRSTYRWYEQQQRPEPDFSWEDGLIAAAG